MGHPPVDPSRLPRRDIHISQLFLDGVWERIVEWTRLAGIAMCALRDGRRYDAPATLYVTQAEMQPWARGILWDARDPGKCVLMAARRPADLAAGSRAVDPDVLDQMAAAVGSGDHDICDQVRHGVESRSLCSLTTVLAFHHTGFAKQFEMARKVIDADLKEGWVLPAAATLPLVPGRCLARNVLLQPRSRVIAGGEIEHYEKPRVSTDESESSSPDSPNAGISRAETELDLASAKDFAAGCGVVAEAFGGCDGIAAYVIDLESAFRFIWLHPLDWWMHIFLYFDSVGQVGFCIDVRMAFGGAVGPQRFQRFMRIPRLYILSLQRRYDAAFPPPSSTAVWQDERRALQARGLLPASREQCEPRYLQGYIDDLNGTGGRDPAPAPPYAAHIQLDTAQLAVTGGIAMPRDCRATAYCLIAVFEMQRLRCATSAPKTQCSDIVVSLGLRVILRGPGRLDCPPAKGAVMIAAARDAAAQVTSTHTVAQDPLERLVGRLCNISQVEPVLTLWLHAGYALVAVRGPRRRGGRAASLRLRPQGRRERELLRLLDLAVRLLETHTGAPLVRRAVFPAHTDPGVALSVTDASGVDGVGGYVVLADQPRFVFLVSEYWPPDVRQALDEAATERLRRRPDAAQLAMPAAEAYGMLVAPLAALAAAAHRRATAVAARDVDVVTAVGDCLPAVRALLAATSSSAQIRHLLRDLHLERRQWLAVHVRRELNTDPDRLSHPAQLRAVAAEVAAAGLEPVHAHVPEWCWGVLRAALHHPTAVDEWEPRFA